MRMTYAGCRARGPILTLAGVVVIFLAFSLPPYFTGGTRVPSTFGLHYPLLVAHVMLGGVAMVTAVVQLWPRLRVRHPEWHRRVGRVYVGAAVPAAVSAMVVGAATPFGPFLAVSNVMLGALWLWFTINGLQSARRRRFADHRRHMVRSATLALSVISNRVWTPVLYVTLQPLQHSVFGGNEQDYLWLVAGAGAWLGWTIPLAIVQWWWLTRKRREPVMAPSSIPRKSDTQPV
jgi:uncharacterized membrane protein